MVKFLIHRPIAVIMSFIAIIMLSLVATSKLPVSLMPDIKIPEITVTVSKDGTSVREMENTVTKRLRGDLQQISDLDNIHSESRDGNVVVRLRFKYGTNIDMSFIEVSEKIDNFMRGMPDDLERPRIIKASITDIPVFMLNISLDSKKSHADNIDQFMQLGVLCESVIKKRIEQLPDVALVDMTGIIHPELYIIPDDNKLKSMGLTQNHIQQALKSNNVTYGSITVQEDQFRYNIRFSSFLRTIEDVKNIYLRVHDRIFQLKDLAEIGIRPIASAGMYLNKDKNAVGMAIIKKKNAQMSALKKSFLELMDNLKADFPETELEITQDQTNILEHTISNLKQSLFWGASLAFLVMFFFLKDLRSPILIGFSIPTSLVISLQLFYFFNISINIISLSGLILGVGMMIDNSIIVIDNITRYIKQGEKLIPSCIQGTNEVISPLISSVLSTCAVFLPLVFLSGISGALFFDQAMAVSIGLFVSLVVAIILLPVLYKLFYKEKQQEKQRLLKKLQSISFFNTEKTYDAGFNFVFKYRNTTLLIFMLFACISVGLFTLITKEKLPQISSKERVLHIDWNQNIHVNENKQRVDKLLKKIDAEVQHANAYISQQQFLLSKDHELNNTESSIYIKTNSPKALKQIEVLVEDYFKQGYPDAKYTFKKFKTLFDRLFPDDEPDLVARITPKIKQEFPTPERIGELQNKLSLEYENLIIQEIPLDEHIVIEMKSNAMLYFEVSRDAVAQKLKMAFNALHVDILKSKQHLPIVISESPKRISEVLKNLFIKNIKGIDLPISNFISINRQKDYKSLVAEKEGSYTPLYIKLKNKDHVDKTVLVNKLSRSIKSNDDLEVQFTGKLFSGDKVVKELSLVLLISILLLYFILASQFESLTQPLIVLLEVPISIAGALGLLYIFGGTINLMSLIGIIVMCGIIINDSILKIDTINRLRKEGATLMEALHVAGRIKLKPILMTSITTILALVPFLFGSDLGSELQKPLALVVIGGMFLGTLVSLYFIPLGYYYLYRNKTQTN